MHPSKFGVSQSVTRKEDDALVRGRGRYVADVDPAGALHAVVLRSPHAHARFAVANIAVARGLPGVRLVLTAPDIAALGGLPCVGIPEGVTVDVPPYPVLARDVVRHVGDAVAFIVADTVEQGKDAAEAISIDWTPLPHVISAPAALAPGAPLVWPERAGNAAFEATLGEPAATASAFDTTARLALDADHRFTALEIDMACDMGAYLSVFAPYIPHVGAAMLPGVYDFPACFVRITAAFTNTLPVDAYRGAGRPEAAYLIERLVDVAARELGIAPDALRRKNFIRPKAMPYTTPTGKVYDSGAFAAHLSRAQEIIDWKGFARRAAQSKKAHKLRGIGLATYIEACGSNGPDAATVRLGEDGNVTVLAGSQSTGQGHATAYAQLVAEHLDVPPNRVTVIQGDTDLIATGAGTGGSSSITCGGASVASAARRLSDNLKALAADALEAAESDLEIENGHVRIAGTDRAVSFAEIAALPAATPAHLSASDAVGPPQPTYPNGTHIAEVEIDPETGHVDIIGYVVVDDFGVTLNPLLLAGQVHGGAVQGIGQAIMEHAVYDLDSGQLVTGTLMDYALPRAEDVPSFVFETRNVRCATNPLGVKGAGEAGTIGSSPAVMNAIVDALHRAFRIRHVDMPATPERLWSAIREGRRVHTM
jgi:carbon-monoxide dehydrogenase large subunit